MPLAIEMRNITKKFPGILANDGIDFMVESGEIHSLLGENGAGKTTLMNVLFGLYRADEGNILINGQKVKIANPKQALQCGLGMIHQHFMLLNRMSVLENVILGHEHGNFTLDMKKSYQVINNLSQKYNFNLDLDEKIENLSVGFKQRVEILKTLYRGADIIILDEPTAVLTPQEVDKLFSTLNFFKKQGKTIIFITHKLSETMEISDRITVLRDGKKVETVKKEDTTQEKLAKLMVGRNINFKLGKQKYNPGQNLLLLEKVKIFDKKDKKVSFSVHSGEILGIAGVEGNGQLEMEEMIVGLREVKTGKILLEKRDITNISTKERKRLRLGYIPSDRDRRAMLANFTIEENIILGYHFHPPFFKRGVIQEEEISRASKKLIEQFNIKATDSKQKIKFLSGGNQQKIIISREVSQDPTVIIAAQPTRGLDIGATEYIHNLLLDLRNQGKAILLISADLTEIMKLSDRIAVLYEGEIMAIKRANLFDEKEIGLLMAGGTDNHK